MQGNKLVYFLIILIVIVGGYFLFFAGSGDQAPQGDMPTEDTVDTMDEGETMDQGDMDNEEMQDQQAPDEDTQAPTPETELEAEQAQPDDPSQPTGDNLVTYTDQGYSPETITVPAGEPVTFVNESSNPMWTASAVHPTHGEYPGEGCIGGSFDACEGVASGNSWSFTFDETGEWGYHNHLTPSHTGTVIVE